MRLRSRRDRLAFVVFILIVLFVVASRSGWLGNGLRAAEKQQPGLYAVSQFIDGDTIAVDMNGTSETIRFIGVDTPETQSQTRPFNALDKTQPRTPSSLSATNVLGCSPIRSTPIGTVTAGCSVTSICRTVL